jgi:hypothetical protein
MGTTNEWRSNVLKGKRSFNICETEREREREREREGAKKKS